MQLYLRDGLETEEHWECCCSVFRGGLPFPFLGTKSPFSAGGCQLCRVPDRRWEESTFPSMCIPLLCRKQTGSSSGMAGDACRTGLSKPAAQSAEEVHTLTSFLLNSYAYIPNIYPSKHYPAYGFQLQSASCFPLPGWFGGFAKSPWMPKASDLLSSRTASYHRNTKGHSNSLQPLSAKGINVQTKPLAVSKINPSSRSPGAQSATYALHRNACSHGSWAAVGSWEPK